MENQISRRTGYTITSPITHDLAGLAIKMMAAVRAHVRTQRSMVNIDLCIVTTDNHHQRNFLKFYIISRTMKTGTYQSRTKHPLYQCPCDTQMLCHDISLEEVAQLSYTTRHHCLSLTL